MCIYMYLYLYIYICTHTHIYVCIYTYVYVHMTYIKYSFIFICIRVRVCICAYTWCSLCRDMVGCYIHFIVYEYIRKKSTPKVSTFLLFHRVTSIFHVLVLIMLQRAAACCSMLPLVAACCSVLRRIALCDLNPPSCGAKIMAVLHVISFWCVAACCSVAVRVNV